MSGIRARQITSDSARFELARRLRKDGVSLGELFSFISGLYFRGKLAYARAFAKAPPKLPGAYVITAGAGLVTPDTPVTLDQLREICAGDVDAGNTRYRASLDRDLKSLSEAAGPDCQFVLLGSIATPKYVKPLLEILRERLFLPAEFIGRGDMSRGGLLLRCASAGTQLTYVPVATAARHGPRPPKLARRAIHSRERDISMV
ncbi:MAG: hypothetical protein JWO91_2227 [Acidobacteriaceae bacterium]|nr:hypothetical protein [Acidobacteriaceae bacterium]